MSSGVLQIAGLTKRYGGVVALSDVHLDIPRDCYVSLLGPSGSGKTVLLRIIAGFEEPDAGQIEFAGRQIVGAPVYDRGIGFVFQNFALFPHLSVYENIAFGLKNRDKPVLAKAELRDRVQAMVDLVGLAGLEARGVHQISGGQRQRVALARTLVTEPRLVLLDEPLGALDANLRTRIRGELRAIRERLGVTFLHVTGSESEALAIGDRVIVLDSRPRRAIRRARCALRAAGFRARRPLPQLLQSLQRRRGAWRFRERRGRLSSPSGASAAGGCLWRAL